MALWGAIQPHMLLITNTIFFAIILMLVALGGCYSEHSGVINIGLEGIMVIGGLAGALVMYSLDAAHAAPVFIVILSILASMAAGILYSLLLGVAAVHLKADQTLVGTAMNMLAAALATIIVKAILGSTNTTLNLFQPMKSFEIFGTHLSNKDSSAFLQEIAVFNKITYFVPLAIILLVVAWAVMYKTKFGLRLRACGEHPQAASSVGISVYKMRYAGVMISGLLGGLGGLVYVTSSSNWDVTSGVCGFGFLALAVMIFGSWKPWRIALAALLFGFFRSLISVKTAPAYAFIENLGINNDIYKMLPYIISLIVLIIFSKNSAAPKAEGIPYDKGSR